MVKKLVCENCFGLLSISIACFIIALILLKRYVDEENRFTLFMVLFFLFAGLGWFIWFLTTEWILNIYNDVKTILMIVGLLPQLVLLIFILTFYEISRIIRVIIILVTVFLSILHIFLPFLKISTIVSTVIIISNGILFMLNWKRNQDIKSLFFAIGLFLILVGESFTFISKLIQGIFLTITAIIWLITYSGFLEKLR